jgi:hypothetical protein
MIPMFNFSRLSALGWAACLTLLVSVVSSTSSDRYAHRDEAIAVEMATLHQLPYVFDGKVAAIPEFRGRILFPVLLENSARVGGR